MGLIARRVARNVRVSDLLRRTVAVVPRLLPGVLLPLAITWVPALAFSLWVGDSEERAREWALFVPAALSTWSIVTATLVSATVVAPVLRAQAGSRLKIADVALRGLSGIGAAFVPALIAGLATMAAFAACVLPGYFVAALLFVVGPVAALEKRGLGSLGRSLELTKGNRLMLAGVAFLVMFLEGVLFRFAQFFEEVGDLGVYFVVGSVITAFTALLRACAAAVAYEQLRVEQEGLELGQLAEQLGGVDTGVDELALSERAMEAMARRRAVVGKLSGQSEPPEEAEAMASVRDMEAATQRQRRRRQIVFSTVGALLGVGTLVALGAGAYERIRQGRQLDAMVAEVQQAETRLATPATSAAQADGFFGAAPLGFADGKRSDALSRQIASNLQLVPKGRRKEMLGRMMAIHANTFYGEGFAEAFAVLGKDGSDSDLITALHIAVQAAGCGEGLALAKQAEKNPARAFAKACPKGETAPLDYRRFRPSTPLGRAALAELLEMRARERRMEAHPLHDVTEQLLLPE
ncbi:MAG: hypothetical protein R3B13_20145 [Polyangiaceae bacterium]